MHRSENQIIVIFGGRGDLAMRKIVPALSELFVQGLMPERFAVLAAWKFLDPVLQAWKEDPSIPVYGYPAGTWGPETADGLIEEPEFTWRYPCKNLADDGVYCEL